MPKPVKSVKSAVAPVQTQVAETPEQTIARITALRVAAKEQREALAKEEAAAKAVMAEHAKAEAEAAQAKLEETLDIARTAAKDAALAFGRAKSKDETYSALLTKAIECLDTLAKAMRVKTPRAARTSSGPRTSGGLTSPQKRVLVHLLSVNEDTSTHCLARANNKPLDTTDRVTTFGAELIGSFRNPDQSPPLSLIGLGYVEAVFKEQGGVEGEKKVATAVLTAAGRKAAEAIVSANGEAAE